MERAPKLSRVEIFTPHPYFKSKNSPWCCPRDHKAILQITHTAPQSTERDHLIVMPDASANVMIVIDAA
jgi:hypothetical protein